MSFLLGAGLSSRSFFDFGVSQLPGSAQLQDRRPEARYLDGRQLAVARMCPKDIGVFLGHIIAAGKIGKEVDFVFSYIQIKGPSKFGFYTITGIQADIGAGAFPLFLWFEY